MPQRNRSSKSRIRAARARVTLAALALIAIAGALVVNFLQSPRGNAFLLDLGSTGRYGAVQNTLDQELKKTLRGLGLDKKLRETSTPVTIGKRRAVRRELSVPVPASESLIRINLALTDAARRAGGAVRSSNEIPDGGGLVLEVGSRKYTTHTIRLLRGRVTPEEARREKPPGERRPRIALVIDDFGYTRDGVVEKFFDLDISITVSVIPELRNSKYCVARAPEKKKQAILHLPMEAESFASEVSPVMTSMSNDEIAALVTRYLDATPGVIGVNNHLGSIATQNVRVMAAVLEVLKVRKLFFLDSLTSSKSVAYNTARNMGVPAARNDLFLDTETEDPKLVETRLDRLLDIAKTRGYAIGIGHPRPWTYEAIRAFKGRAKGAGLEFVFVSELLE